ncbi:hypothetical protein NC796_20225 [Aliifodinibius sp. S!AR15-10]|uniref:hypothetical protein n=1 Tax=Aliifodinibius sp. S!AR15-10 TaxID=2950437 RepID=UPI00285BFC24|nr:hypothetical protein [Aliifodinibius sp. S!AR15-10]MDR8393493.1 hypothetical protein [Aliifodinibius sp. S!AR15-10]
MEMDRQTIELLEKEYGDAFYVFDEDKYISNLNEVKTAFEDIYSNIGLAYSFKTNYMPRICQIAKDKGVLAEVVSKMEYELALKVGYSPNEIIFNGPIKKKEILFRAFENNSIVHFDNEDEIDCLEEFLINHPEKTVRCAVRCNFALKGEETSRFGINAEDDNIERVYKRLFQLKGCKPIGIHCHFSTSTRSLKSYTERTRKIITVAKKVFDKHPCKYIDIGGGYFGNMSEEMKAQFSCKVPDFKEYAESICNEMVQSFPDQKVKLILEPGTMVVADTVKFYCKVNNVKNIRGNDIVMVHGSIHNTKPMGRSRILPPYRLIPMHKGKKYFVNSADITGYTCIEDDILAYDVSGEIAVGDFIEFSNVGAYSLMYKPPFIKGQPYILSKRNNQYITIKRDELMEDIFSLYVF